VVLLCALCDFLKSVIVLGKQVLGLFQPAVHDAAENLLVFQYGLGSDGVDVELVVHDNQVEQGFDFSVLLGHIRVVTAFHKGGLKGDGVLGILMLVFHLQVSSLYLECVLQKAYQTVDFVLLLADFQGAQKHAEDGFGHLCKTFLGNGDDTRSGIGIGFHQPVPFQHGDCFSDRGVAYVQLPGDGHDTQSFARFILMA